MNEGLSVKIDAMRYPGSKDPGNLIEGLSFHLPPGSFVSFLGRTGAGKTTLLRIIAGLERRYIGEVRLDAAPVVRPSRDVQIVFQDYRLVPWKTVLKNIAFASRSTNGVADCAQLEKWIGIVGLQTRRDAWPKTLSGGETGRVAFARAFVDQPKVLLLDEPFRGLDLVTRIELQDALLRALEVQNTSVILVSHSVDDAVFLSNTVHILTEHPMRIERSVKVDAERPRRRGDMHLADASASITAYLANRARREP